MSKMSGHFYLVKWHVLIYPHQIQNKIASPFWENSFFLNFNKRAVTLYLLKWTGQVQTINNLVFGYLLIRENKEVLSSLETEIYKVDLCKAFDNFFYSSLNIDFIVFQFIDNQK